MNGKQLFSCARCGYGEGRIADEVERLRAENKKLVEAIRKQVDGYEEYGYDGINVGELRALLEQAKP